MIDKVWVATNWDEEPFVAFSAARVKELGGMENVEEVGGTDIYRAGTVPLDPPCLCGTELELCIEKANGARFYDVDNYVLLDKREPCKPRLKGPINNATGYMSAYIRYKAYAEAKTFTESYRLTKEMIDKAERGEK